MNDWKDRVIGFDRKPAHQFLANPKNPRSHPNEQRDVLRGSMETLGNYDVVIENQRTGHLIDGHARIEEALSVNEDMLIPYIIVDLSEAEEALALASHDYITTMANYMRDSLDALLHDVQTDDVRLQAMLSELAELHTIDIPDAKPQLEPILKSERLIEIRCSEKTFQRIKATLGQWQDYDDITIDIS